MQSEAFTISRNDRIDETSAVREHRWQEEAKYFDREAEQILRDLRPTNPGIVARYRNPAGKTPLEYCYKVAGNLKGKRVLDVGCGNGSTSVLLAELGAHVTGIDISPRSIEVAHERAKINGVDSRTQFVCAPLETVDLPENGFDVIWCEAILHHLLADIHPIMNNLRRWAKPDGLVIVSEPINHVQWLRKLRMSIPVEVNGTPDERPLYRSETKAVESYISKPKSRYFRLLCRLERALFKDSVYERSAKWKQSVYDLASALDSLLTVLPGTKHLSSMTVIYGNPKK